MKTLRQKHLILTNLIGEAETKRLLHAWYDRAIRREQKRADAVEESGPTADFFCREVLRDLHERTGLQYRLSKATKTAIMARKNDGFTVEDFRHVHEVKTAQWVEDEEMKQYLHPSTLYRASKFEKYLVQWEMYRQKEKQRELERELKRKRLEEQERYMEAERKRRYEAVRKRNEDS
jgi:uncharacterized phage protein (TIGR02220 family)